MCQYEKDPVRIAHNYRSQFWAYPPFSSSLSRAGALETVFRFHTSASFRPNRWTLNGDIQVGVARRPHRRRVRYPQQPLSRLAFPLITACPENLPLLCLRQIPWKLFGVPP